jgi:hypothetical protein
MLKHLLANCNTAIAAAVGSIHLEEGTVIECKISDKDLSGPAAHCQYVSPMVSVDIRLLMYYIDLLGTPDTSCQYFDL